jgi:tetratricopeptide (TPR) repeat protein
MLDESDEPSSALAGALVAATTLVRFVGDLDKARLYGERAVDMARRVDDDRRLAYALVELARVHQNIDAYPATQGFLDEALVVARRAADGTAEAEAMSTLGRRFMLTGEDHPQARALLLEARRLRDRMGDAIGTTMTSLFLVGLACDTKDAHSAGRHLRDALDLHAPSGALPGVGVNLLEASAALAALLGDHPTALRLTGAAAQLRRTIDHPIPPSWRRELERRVAPATSALVPDAVAGLINEGGALSVDHAIALARAFFG